MFYNDYVFLAPVLNAIGLQRFQSLVVVLFMQLHVTVINIYN